MRALATARVVERFGAVVVASAALIAGAAAQQGAMFAATAFPPSHPDAFAFEVVSSIFLTNALAFIVLLLPQRVGARLGLTTRRIGRSDHLAAG